MHKIRALGGGGEEGPSGEDKNKSLSPKATEKIACREFTLKHSRWAYECQELC